MSTYTVTIDLPIIIEVKASSIEEAVALADSTFAELYDQIEYGIALPENVVLGNRYDETECEETKLT
jgi:hypothetical protein